MLPSRVRTQFAALVAVVTGVVAVFVFNGISALAGGGSLFGVDAWTAFTAGLQVSVAVTIGVALLTWATGTTNAAGRVAMGALTGAALFLVAVYFGLNPGFAWIPLVVGVLYGAVCGAGYHVGKLLSDNA